ncbi:hypothetical protein BurJ1DRAFT_1078 [Burkholderiales bacterium JOSHI_001]|nr:hypothetical protein BurJ1DRAFT_1078 [Burkholderiales bacterium JOSHI_001]
MTEEWGIAPPPFKPEIALQTLKRELRALGLTEREGRFERKATPIAKAVLAADGIDAARVKRPSRNSPEWLPKRLRSSAEVRDFVADLKKQLAQWSDSDD